MNWVEDIFEERMDIKFHRYSEQCRNCCCYTENIKEEDCDEWLWEAIQLLECTLEQPCWENTPCRFYLEIEKEEDGLS